MRVAAIAALIALSGCAGIERHLRLPSEWAGAHAEAFTRSAAEDLAQYLARVGALPEAAQAAEARRQRAAAARGDDLARTKAAIALLLTPQPDEAEVLSLVEPVARRESGDPALRGMASFLHAMASERRRLRDSAAAANARLRDERKAHEAQRTRADAALERALQLQQKLEALTEIEKSLSDRPLSSR